MKNWNLYVKLAVFLYGLSVIEARNLSPAVGESARKDTLWQPKGRSREEWMKCHGYPCDEWEITRRKLVSLKLASTGPGFDINDVNLTDIMDDSLDNCIWLTGEQIDEILEHKENEFFNDRKAGTGHDVTEGEPTGKQSNDAKKGRPKEGRRGTRGKRAIEDFQSRSFYKWPLPIHWKFDGAHNSDEKAMIRAAFDHWQHHTCVRFKELPTGEPVQDYHLLITKQPTGCHSFVGRVGATPQQLNLQYDCLYAFGIPVHEVGHALGLWHEQQRWDRDDHIKVLWGNLGYYVGQYYKHYNPDLGVEYDHGSVMHYAPRDGAKNGQLTMKAIDPLYQHNMGQRTGLSYNDAHLINLAYCRDTCSSPLARDCLRGGYQDPNDCRRCKCPDGFGGTYCDAVAPSVRAVCGGEISVNTSGQFIQSPGYNVPGYYESHQECNWLITAAAGHQVVLEFVDEFAVYCHNQQQCHHWVEVQYKDRIGKQGPRFCCYDRPSAILQSDTSEMLIVFRANWNVPWPSAKKGFRAFVRAAPTAAPSMERTSTSTPVTPTPTTTTTTVANTTPTTPKPTTTPPTPKTRPSTTTTTTTTPPTTTPTPTTQPSTTTPTPPTTTPTPATRPSTTTTTTKTTTTTTTPPTTTLTPTTRPSTTTTKTSFPTTTTTAASQTTTTPIRLTSDAGSRTSRTLWKCGFETEAGEASLCGMEQDEADDFDWSLWLLGTPSYPTGPSWAHSGTWYVYIETSNPRRPADRAGLILPHFEEEGERCLKFNYHMYGFHVNTLQFVEKSPEGATSVLWQRSRDHGDQWLSGRVTFQMKREKQYAFVGIRGDEYSGDIAIDDLQLMTGPCVGESSRQRDLLHPLLTV